MMDKVTHEEKEKFLKDSLIQRDVERKEKLKVLKEERELLYPNEIKVYEINFDRQTKTIVERIKFIEEKDIGYKELPESLDTLKQEINTLSDYVAVSSKILSNYTLKRSLETVESFENRLQDLEAKLLPKRRFAFKAKKENKKVKPALVKKDTTNSIDEIDSVARKMLSLSSSSCGFSDRKNENLKLCSDEIAKNDVELKNLDNCTIFLCGNPSTVHMSNIRGCKIFSGPVSTSVFIEDCFSSVIVTACQQLRIHTTIDTSFYIHITSRVIIEGTRNIQLAPYNLKYEGLEDHFHSSGLCESPNNWNMVDDFNWLASNTPSPNWREMSEEERVVTWTSFINF